MVSQTQPVQTQVEILASLNPQINVNIHGQGELVMEKLMVKGFLIIQQKFSAYDVNHNNTYIITFNR